MTAEQVAELNEHEREEERVQDAEGDCELSPAGSKRGSPSGERGR